MAASIHTIDAVRTGYCPAVGEGENEHVITYRYTPGRPARMYLRNGDPGYPADPAVVEFVSISPGAGDVGAFSDIAQRHLEEWAADWLADHEDDAIELAEDAIEDAREHAAELRAAR